MAETGARTDCQNYLTWAWIDCEETKTVYEICDCYWHGHTFLPFRDVSTTTGDRLEKRYEHTMTRLEKIAWVAYQVEVHCECETDELILAKHPELKTHTIVHRGPLNTRDALHGGRRTCCCIIRGDHLVRTRYVTICFRMQVFQIPYKSHSNSCGRSVSGHRQCHRKTDWYVLSCRRNVSIIWSYHRCDKRLMFCLCRTCPAVQNWTADWTHESIAERALVGMWVMDEVRLAVEKGYQIVEVYEVYEYEVSRSGQRELAGSLLSILTHSWS